MKFQISKSRLQDFINHIKLNGVLPDGSKQNLIDQFEIKVSKDKLSVMRSDHSHACFIAVSVSADVKESGTLPIDIDEFEKYVKRMGKDITVSFDDVTIKLEDGTKKIEYAAPAGEIENFDELPFKKEDGKIVFSHGTELDTVFEINSKYLQDIVKDSKELESVKMFPINVQEETVMLTVGDEQSATSTITAPITEFKGEPVSGKFGMGFNNVFSNVSGNLRIFMANGEVPLFVEMIDTSAVEFQAMLSPLLSVGE